MKKFSIVALVVASMVGSLPSQAAADAKDVAIGAILGAIGQKIVSDSKQQQRTTRSNTSTRSTTTQRQYVPPSLNSQFSRDERIQIQSSLASLGYGVGTIDGVLGPNSRRVIGQFQAARGEAATGQMTRAQYVALVSSVSGTTPVFARRELTRDEVRLLQQGLQQLGYYQGGIDGSKGPGTRGALTQFLAQNGLNAAQTTPVQGLVLARNAAQLPTAMYLQQEAGASFAGGVQQPQQFGTQPQQQTLQAGFGQQPQQPANPFAAPVPQQNAFGAPAQVMPQQQQNQTTGFAAAPAPANSLFGTPQQVPQPGTQVLGAPQQQAPSGQQNLFAPTAPQQQAPQVAPTGTQPQQGLFAAGTTQQVAPQVQQSTLDIFSAPSTAQPVPATGQAQLAVPQQQVPVAAQQPQGSLFGTPASN